MLSHFKYESKRDRALCLAEVSTGLEQLAEAAESNGEQVQFIPPQLPWGLLG
jgi:hypothetical protein